MGKLLIRALALFVAVLGLQVASAPAQAAVTWTQVDRVCKTYAAGKICATVQKDGTGNFRARTTVAPAAGKWLQPSWHSLSGINFGGAEYFCDPNEFCSRKTSNWASAFETWSGGMFTYTGGVKLPSGALARVSAGAGAWQSFGKKCATVTSGQACVSLYVRSNRDAVDIRSRFALTPAAGQSMTPTLVRAKLTSGANVWQASKTLSGARTSPYAVEVIKYGAKPRTSWNAFAIARWTDAAGNHSISEDMP